MSYYRTCPHCGATLDPGEICECVQSSFSQLTDENKININALISRKLEEQGYSVGVIDMHTIKPIDRDIIVKAAKETGRIITVEEHSVIGGLGSAVADVVTEECPVPVIKIGVKDVFGHSGPAVDLLKEFGLCAENIVAVTKAALGK
mgnify:CR=1 FL=1